ncbi:MULTISPECIES: hypothetical protein [Exiguobacterium]|uniref:hypothetical protein n=1 Tax=Exiguobacterium TaxID=33986 RepID=UPI00047978C2|nr:MULTISPECIES: hypothetical protein [Exiguobacterium]MCT4780937.1 hypothetical protein [Exiguobacterium soli]
MEIGTVQQTELKALYQEMHQRTTAKVWGVLALFLFVSSMIEQPLLALIIPILYFVYDATVQHRRFQVVARYTTEKSASRLFRLHVGVGLFQYGALAVLIVLTANRSSTVFLLGLCLGVIPFYWLCRRFLIYRSKQIDPTYISETDIQQG